MRDAIDKAIETLNQALEADREAVQEIIDCRVPTDADKWEDIEAPIMLGQQGTIGPLGLMNGLFDGQLAAQYDENGTLTRFLRFPIETSKDEGI